MSHFTRTEITEGFYFWQSQDGSLVRYIKVKANKAGHLYASGWFAQEERWDYVQGLIAKMRSGIVQVQKVDAEKASQFGSLYGVCIFCAKHLSDDRSIEVGYGPVCASKNDLPWG